MKLRSSAWSNSTRSLQPESEVKAKVGEPKGVADGVWTYKSGNRIYRITFTPEKKLSSVVEVLPGGAEMTLVQ